MAWRGGVLGAGGGGGGGHEGRRGKRQRARLFSRNRWGKGVVAGGPPPPAGTTAAGLFYFRAWSRPRPPPLASTARAQCQPACPVRRYGSHTRAWSGGGSRGAAAERRSRVREPTRRRARARSGRSAAAAPQRGARASAGTPTHGGEGPLAWPRQLIAPSAPVGASRRPLPSPSTCCTLPTSSPPPPHPGATSRSNGCSQAPLAPPMAGTRRTGWPAPPSSRGSWGPRTARWRPSRSAGASGSTQT